jgi:IS4 transposase
VTLPGASRRNRSVTVTAILAREEQPAGWAGPAIEWRLLTNRAAETLEDIVQLMDWYRRRWLIEIFFRIWKSGCKIESLQLGRAIAYTDSMMSSLAVAEKARLIKDSR